MSPAPARRVGNCRRCAGHFGLELGSRIGTRTGERGELIGGLALIGVGAAVAGGII